MHKWKDGVCSECEYVCQHKDDNNDHFCDICSKKISDHIGGKATCTQKAVCTICNQLYGKVDSSNHTGKEEWIQTEKTHEKKWNCCNLVTVAGEEHEWENGICSECGYICNHTGGTATCIAKAVCTTCGIEYGEKDFNKHENLYHAAQAPTCTKNGHEAYWKCKNCAKLFSDEAGKNEINNPVEINANGHDLKKVEKKAPTCTEIGWEAYDTCKREGCKYSTYKEIAALDHDLEHHEAKAATCTEIGWEAYDTCKREGCNYTTYKELPALNHDLEHHEAKAATCTENGWDAYDICKRDGCKYTTYKELPALGHEDSNNDHLCDACSTKISDHSYESKIAREATTTYTGIRIYTCTKCGRSYTEELAKLPSQTNQADQTNQIEPVNNGNEKDFIGTVTSVFLNVTDLAAKNFRISFWLMIQMLLKAVMQLG